MKSPNPVTPDELRAPLPAATRQLANRIRGTGFEPALRDRAAQLASIQLDFSNREWGMADRYREALAALASDRRRRGESDAVDARAQPESTTPRHTAGSRP